MNMPQVPVSVWEQIPIIIVFSILMAGLGWVFMKLFSRQIDKTHEMYSKRIDESNQQWQRYFDARAEGFLKMSADMEKRLDHLAAVLEELRGAIAVKRSPARKKADG